MNRPKPVVTIYQGKPGDNSVVAASAEDFDYSLKSDWIMEYQKEDGTWEKYNVSHAVLHFEPDRRAAVQATKEKNKLL